MTIPNYLASKTDWTKNTDASVDSINRVEGNIKNNRVFMAIHVAALHSASNVNYYQNSVFDVDEYVDGMTFLIKVNVNSVNSDGLNINSLGRKPILKYDEEIIATDDLIAGDKYLMIYYADLDSFVIPYPLIGGARSPLHTISVTHTDEAVTFNEADVSLTLNDCYINEDKIELGNSYALPIDQAVLNDTHIMLEGGLSKFDFEFNSDGTKAFLLDGLNNNILYQYSLSTPYLLSSLSYDGVSFNLTFTNITNARGVFFKPDGTKFYVVGDTPAGVESFSMSTIWNISTATHDGKFFAISEDANPRAIFFKPDGTTFYSNGTTNDMLYQYNLSTSWDIATASYSSKYADVSLIGADIYDIFIKSDGTECYITGLSSESIHKFDFGTAWDISTISLDTSLNMDTITTPNSDTVSVTFKPDMKKMYVMNNGEGKVFEFNVWYADLTALTGTAYVRFSDPEDIYEWDLATLQTTELDGSVTVDIEQSDTGAVWAAVLTDIVRNTEIEGISKDKLLRFKVSITRASTSEHPSCDYLALRYER